MSERSWSRLREAPLDDAADPVVAHAARLLRAEEPLPPSSARIDRVRPVALAEPPVAPRWGGAWRLVPSPAATAMTIGLLAAAGLLAWWWSGDAAPPATASIAATPATPRAPSLPAAPTSSAPSPSPLPSSPLPSSPLASSVPPAARAPSRTRPTGDAHPPAVAPSPPAPSLSVAVPPAAAAPPAAPAAPIHESAAGAATDTEGAELLVKATRLLRHEDDPAAARALIERYLDGHPDGALAEEALYLDVEAGSALQDGTLGPLAARYLSRYPRGRFRAAVINLRDGR